MVVVGQASPTSGQLTKSSNDNISTSTTWPDAVAKTASAIDSNGGFLRSRYAPVVGVAGLSHYDRFAFACRFLDDADLLSFLDATETTALRQG